MTPLLAAKKKKKKKWIHCERGTDDFGKAVKGLSGPESQWEHITALTSSGEESIINYRIILCAYSGEPWRSESGVSSCSHTVYLQWALKRGCCELHVNPCVWPTLSIESIYYLVLIITNSIDTSLVYRCMFEIATQMRVYPKPIKYNVVNPSCC